MLLDELSAEQAAAATALQTRIAVLAGPGSGKTRTLSTRVRFLLERDSSDRALILAFMNKAAAEVKARCLEGAPFQSDRVFAGTFHALGVDLLRKHGHLVGVESDFEILDELEARQLAGLSASEMVDLNRHRASDVSVDPQPRSYVAAKRTRGVVDYDDLIVLSARLLAHVPELAEAYGLRFPHVLIDEFQDTDAGRFALVGALAPHVKTISVFADGDQAIMGFGGADRAHVDRFIAELEATTFVLRSNHRSRAAIVEVANRLIANAGEARFPMVPERGGGSVTVSSYLNEADEARGVVDAVQTQLLLRRPADVAILVRSKKRGEALSRELENVGIPYSDWRERLVSQELGRDLGACLASLRGSLPEKHKRRLAELGGMDLSTVDTVADALAVLEGTPLGAMLSRTREAALERGDVVEVTAVLIKGLTVLRPQYGTQLEDLRETVASLAANDSAFSVDQLLVELALGGTSARPTTTATVKLATLHRTKGLEWPVVFLAGLEQSTLPTYYSLQARDVSEERRLCFVGVTRAMDELRLSYAERVEGWAKGPSCFLSEMAAP